MNGFTHTLDPWLGLATQPKDFTLLQISLRGLVVFFAALILLRLAHKRFFATKNAIDILLSFVLASTLSRAINGSAGLFTSLFVCCLLVVLHNAITRLAARYPRLGGWVKGHPFVIIRDGKVDREMLARHHLSQRDLEEDLRSHGAVEDPSRVREAMLERSGQISVRRKASVTTVSVHEGVQTIRIEVGG